MLKDTPFVGIPRKQKTMRPMLDSKRLQRMHHLRPPQLVASDDQTKYPCFESEMRGTQDMIVESATLVRVNGLWEKIRLVITEHLETLAHRRLALITTDVYGVMNTTKWDEEVDYFVENVVLKRLAAEDISEVEQLCFGVADAVKSSVPELTREQLKGNVVTPQTTPEEFEHWCKGILLSNGWTARTTQRSGDQGADVIAEKFGIRLVIQCKLYNYTVGNKAVQEAYAAKAHYQAAIAAVVTNSSFTTSAQALANTTGVLLLHHSQLNSLENLIGNS